MDAKPASPKRQLRNFLLDAPFQLKFASYFVAITLILSLMLLGFLVRTADTLFDQISGAVAARSKSAETNRELGRCLLNNELAVKMDDPEFAALLEQRTKLIDQTFEAEQSAAVAQKQSVESQQNSTLVALIFGLTLFTVLIALFSIVVTHRIVGPLFRFKRMTREVTQGVLRPPTYGLRPGDELHDLFDLFKEMITQLRAKTEVDLQRVQAGINGDAAALEALKKELEDRLNRS